MLRFIDNMGAEGQGWLWCAAIVFISGIAALNLHLQNYALCLFNVLIALALMGRGA
jgi:hypothetical protein